MFEKENIKLVTQKQLQQIITEVRKDLLTSNHIVDRSKQPYFFNSKNVPQALFEFKNTIVMHRKTCSELVAKTPDLPLSVPETFKSFNQGTFAHALTGSMVVSSLFKIGECEECSAQLSLELIKKGYGNIGLVGMSFPKANFGMETSHMMIVANLAVSPNKPNKKDLSIYEFFKILPSETIIGDAFLDLCFTPKNVPNRFIEYINAYGAETKIIQFTHLYNFSMQSVECYINAAENIKKVMLKNSLTPNRSYQINEENRIKDTSVVTWLKEKSNLAFFAVCDKDFKVDVIVELNNMEDKNKALDLQRAFHGYGRFFNSNKNKIIFVLEGVNLSNDNYSSGGFIRSF